MQSRQRYHIIIDAVENVPVVREQLERSSYTDIKAWSNFPLLLSASLTEEQYEWVKRHPNVAQGFVNNNIYLHEDTSQQYELTTQSAANAAALKIQILKEMDVVINTYKGFPENLYVVLDQPTYKTLLTLAVNWPLLTGVSVNNNPVREYSRVLNQARYNWGVERVSHRANTLFENVSFTQTGKGVRVYVVDSGVQSNHDELVGRVDQHNRYDAFRQPGDPLYSEPSTDVKFEDGQVVTDDHGTHVASLIAGSTVGIAPAATIISVRAFSNFENSTSESLLDAVDWIISNHVNQNDPSIVNMSLELVDTNLGGTSLSDLIVGALMAAGITCVVSAGNNSTDAFLTSPANAGVTRELSQHGSTFTLDTKINPAMKPIVVGASIFPNSTPSGNDSIWAGSNWGDVVDVIAPGVEIFGASLAVVGDHIDLNQTGVFDTKTGTSTSAPIVAGICALHLEVDPALTPVDLRQRIVDQATRNPFATKEVVHDRIDAARYVDIAGVHTLVVPTNSKVYTPNLLSYAWYTNTSIVWDDQSYELTVNEKDQFEFSLGAISTDKYKDLERVDFSITALDVPESYSGNFMIFYKTTEYQSSIGNVQLLKDSANFRINAPTVKTDIVGNYVLLADDGRVESARRFSITTINVPTPPYWVTPASGNILYAPVKQGDTFDFAGANTKHVVFNAVQDDGLPIAYTITPTIKSLPPGLSLKPALPADYPISQPTQAYLSGTVTRVPFSLVPVVYEFLVRATSIAPDGTPMIAERLFSIACEYDHEKVTFDPNWLAGLFEVEPGIHYLGTTSLGNSYYKQLVVINPSQIDLTYTISAVPGISVDNTNFNAVLPTGLGLSKAGEIVGIVDPSAFLGKYYIRVTVNDPFPNAISPIQDFVLQVEVGDQDVLQDSDQIVWITPEGSIGSIWETFPSHVGVQATNPEGSLVSYALSPNAGPLPEGLEVDGATGYITGLAPMVEIDTEYDFMIRAIVGSRFVDRAFSITIKNQYKDASVLIFRSNLMGPDRLDISDWTLASKNITRDQLFRPTDANFGATRTPHMYVISGTMTAEPAVIMDALADYHHRMNLLFGALDYAPSYDPDGNYVYDVVYIRVIDPLEKAGGFTNGVEDTLTMPVLDKTDGKVKQHRYYPNNLTNARADLARNPPEGLGLDGQEGMPMWMRKKGFTPGIIVAYVKPNLGLKVANQLALKGFNDKFTGREFTMDRYFVASLITRESTRFDVVDDIAGTTFDDPTRLDPADQYGFSQAELDALPSQTQPTRFDLKTFETGKYYKFEDDAPILADRYNNPDKFKPYGNL